MRGLWIALVILIVAIGAATYLLYPRTQQGLSVKAWTDSPEYLTQIKDNPPYCNDSGSALIKLYSNVNLDGNVVTDGSVTGYIRLANGTDFGGEKRLDYNATSRLWESGWYYSGCVEPGNYSVDIIAVSGDNTATGTYQFAVKGIA